MVINGGVLDTLTARKSNCAYPQHRFSLSLACNHPQHAHTYAHTHTAQAVEDSCGSLITDHITQAGPAATA
jgi:hypothetical protein